MHTYVSDENRVVWQMISEEEGELIMFGKHHFSGIGFNREDALMIAAAAKLHGYTHTMNDGMIAVFEKHWKDDRFEYSKTIRVGKELRGTHWMAVFEYFSASKRYRWLIGETDYPTAFYARTLTRHGWWTGD